jgi:dihydropteroate synthase
MSRLQPEQSGPPTLGGREFRWGRRSYCMAILNVTPDSFSADGVGTDVAAAVALARRAEAEGADILDIGGESTRPGHRPVAVEEELRRVLPALQALRGQISLPISVDTRHAAVARACLDAGAAIVNDVSGLADPAMAPLLTAREAGVVIVAGGPRRAGDVVRRVRAELDAALERALAAGVRREQIVLDPGFGFGKTPDENLVLLARLGELSDYELPLLVGLSRKRTIAHVLGEGTQQSPAANAALTALAVANGADIVRVHDVAVAVAAARLADAVHRRPPPAATGTGD